MKILLFVCFLFALAVSELGFSQAGNVGSGFHNTAGKENGSGNLSGNSISITINRDCVFCSSKNVETAKPKSKAWHPPLVYLTGTTSK